MSLHKQKQITTRLKNPAVFPGYYEGMGGREKFVICDVSETKTTALIHSELNHHYWVRVASVSLCPEASEGCLGRREVKGGSTLLWCPDVING